MTKRIVVDARGTGCPGPIARLARAYTQAGMGDEIEVLTTDPGVKPLIEAWVKRTGNELVELKEENGIIKAVIRVTAKK